VIRRWSTSSTSTWRFVAQPIVVRQAHRAIEQLAALADELLEPALDAVCGLLQRALDAGGPTGGLAPSPGGVRRRTAVQVRAVAAEEARVGTEEIHGAEPHRLWWRPGDGHGRGILFRSGHVHTWPEAEGEHRQMASLRPERPLMFFLIRPDGRVRIPQRHAGSADRIAEALRSADARLRPFDPCAAAAA
jgi:hypothetical protein